MHESYIRYSAEEKESIILTIKRSELSIVQTLKRLGIPRRTFYNWYKKYAIGGLNALRATHCRAPTTWNRIPDNIRQIVVKLSLEHPELTPENCQFFYWKRVIYLFQSQAFIVYYTKEVYWNVWSMILSLQLMSSIIRLNSPMRCGRQTDKVFYFLLFESYYFKKLKFIRKKK